MAKLELDKELIRELAALLEETGLSEIEITDEGRSLRVSRAGTVNAVAAATPASTPAAPPATGEAAPVAPDADLSQHPGAVLSPMVGTAYVAPEPGAPPFVTVGDTVSEGQPLLIVEAMKTMNQIPAPRSGKITRILVTDAQPVEYGDPLMIIE